MTKRLSKLIAERHATLLRSAAASQLSSLHRNSHAQMPMFLESSSSFDTEESFSLSPSFLPSKKKESFENVGLEREPAKVSNVEEAGDRQQPCMHLQSSLLFFSLSYFCLVLSDETDRNGARKRSGGLSDPARVADMVERQDDSFLWIASFSYRCW